MKPWCLREAAPAVLIAVCALASVCSGLVAQTAGEVSVVVEGVVLEEGTEHPVPGASLTWIRAGAELERVVSGSYGTFSVELAEGDYVLEASGLGYAATRTPMFSLTEEDAADGPLFLEVMLTPAPIELEGLDVAVDRQVRRELQVLGLTREALGDRLIGRDRIERMIGAPGPRDLIRNSNVAGVTVSNNPHVLCVRFARGTGCAATLLNGIELTHGGALDLDPGSIHSIALLNPAEATLRYGQKGRGGAVLIWTRDGRAR